MFKRFIGMTCLIMVMIPVAVLLAQGSLTELFVASDDAYSFRYPDIFTAEELTRGARLTDDRMTILFLGPAELEELHASMRSAEMLLDWYVDRVRIQGSRALTLTINGRDALKTSYVAANNDRGIVYVVTFADGDWALVDVTFEGRYMRSWESEVLDIVATFGLPDGTTESSIVVPSRTSGGSKDETKDGTTIQPTPTPTPFPTLAPAQQQGSVETMPRQLAQYDQHWQTIVGELEDTGVIPSGGNLIFTENYAFFSGQGSFYIPLASGSPYADFAIGGRLIYTAGDTNELETCGLTARLTGVQNGVTNNYIDIGLDSDGDLFYLDLVGDDDYIRFDTLPVNDPFGTPHYILVILRGESMSIYFDGDLALEDVEVRDRAGTYAISMDGHTPASRCEATDLWAFSIPDYTPGICNATTVGTINMRTGPSTSQAVAGQMRPGERLRIEAMITGADGFTWYLLENDAWARDDVVTEIGDCDNLPVFND